MKKGKVLSRELTEVIRDLPDSLTRTPKLRQAFGPKALEVTRYGYSTRKWKPTGATTVYLNERSQVTPFSVSKSYTNNLDWKQKVVRRQDASSAYTTTQGDCIPLRWVGFCNGPNVESFTMGTRIGNSNIDTSDDTILRDIALSKLKSKVMNHIEKADILVPVFELRDLRSTINSITGFTTDTVLALIKAKRSGGKSLLKQVSNLWLTWSFGIQPMLSDAARLANAVESYKTRDDHFYRLTGKASKIWNITSVTNSGNIAEGATLDILSVTEQQLSYQYVAGINYKLRSTANYTAEDHLGLRLGGVVPALWELTAFSWVVDYFSTVGAWLDDVFFTLPGTTQYIVLNKRYVNATDYDFRLNTTAGYYYNGTIDPGFMRYASFARSVLTSLPTRALRIRTTDEVGKYALTKLMNLAAVLGGGLKVKLKR